MKNKKKRLFDVEWYVKIDNICGWYSLLKSGEQNWSTNYNILTFGINVNHI